MKYRRLGGEERSVLAALRFVGLKPAEIARELGRCRSTVSRELTRNGAPYDGWYRARRAQPDYMDPQERGGALRSGAAGASIERDVPAYDDWRMAPDPLG